VRVTWSSRAATGRETRLNVPEASWTRVISRTIESVPLKPSASMVGVVLA
jgi:hypothetical protein